MPFHAILLSPEIEFGQKPHGDSDATTDTKAYIIEIKGYGGESGIRPYRQFCKSLIARNIL
jgi:hypothetical protein